MKPKAVGVHIYAGGFTAGIKQAGFDVVCHLEEGTYGVTNAKENWPDLSVFTTEDDWPLDILAAQDIDLVYCNPPCAIFSSAGIATTRGPDAWRSDSRLQCWHQAIQVFQKVQPKTFVLESVCQAYTKGREIVDEFTKLALDMGYSVQHVLMDAKWTGIPQSRKRFFLVFHQRWLPLEFRFSFKNTVTVGEVLDQIDEPGFILPNRWMEDKECLRILRRTKPGQKLRTVFDNLNPGLVADASGKIPGRPSFLSGRLHPDKQMGAFIGNVFIHPYKHRYLGLNEMKALCGYPKDFKFVGTPTAIPGLIARAVLPSVGYWLGRCVRAVIKQPKREWCSQEVSCVDIRKIEAKYVSLSKEYEVGSKLSSLVQDYKSCSKCTSMAGRRRLLSAVNGSPDASVLIIGEAPGYDDDTRGTNGCPLYGGATGVNFDIMLRKAGIERNQIFISNAVICNPGSGSSNRRPSEDELKNCRSHLQDLIATINPRLIVTLGQIALDSLAAVEPHNFKLGQSVGRIKKWNGIRILPLYHPSPRTLSVRPLARQIQDLKRSKAYTTPYKEPFNINKKAKFKIGMTGFTRAQAFPRTEKDLRRVCQKIDVPAALRNELCQQGYEVDWAVCELGDKREFDALIVMLGLCTSLHGVQYAAQSLWSIHQALTRNKPCVIFQDDWKIKPTYSQLSSFHRNFDTSVKKRYKNYSKCNFKQFAKLKEELTNVATLLTEGEWPRQWSCLLPMYSGWGDRSRAVRMLRTRRVLTIDATPSVINLRKQQAACTTKRQWFLASLGDHRKWVDQLELNWPVTYAGHQKCGGRLSTEDDVRNAVQQNWGSLSPPYPQAGSGWWRSRYVYSALANRVIFTDPVEAEVMGSAYQFDPLEFEQMTLKQRKELAREQRRWLIDGGRVNLQPEQLSNEVVVITSALKGNVIENAVVEQVEKKTRKKVAQKVPKVTSGTNSNRKTSGEFIRTKWMTGEYTCPGGPERLVQEVHNSWPQFSISSSRECRTKVQDIRWNVKKLQDDGVEGVPPFPQKV